MVKLPTRDDLGPLPSARTGRAHSTIKTTVPDTSVAYKGGEAIGRGLQNLGKGFDQIAATIQQKQDEDDALDLMRADAELKLRLARRANQYEAEDQDHRTWGPRYAADSAADVEEISGTIRNPNLREKFGIQANLNVGLGAEGLTEKSRHREKVAQRASFEEALQTHRKRYYEAKTNEERQRVLYEFKVDRDLAISRGVIDEADDVKYASSTAEWIKDVAAADASENPRRYRLRRLYGSSRDVTALAEGTDDASARKYGLKSGYDMILAPEVFGLPQKPVSEMTLKELDTFQQWMLSHPGNKWNSSAAGRYQIVNKTLKEFMAAAGLTWEDKFTPENQDKLFDAILKGQGFGAWEGYKKHPELLEVAQGAGMYNDLDPSDGVEIDAKAREAETKPGSPFAAKERFHPSDGSAPLPFNFGNPDEKQHANAYAESNGWMDQAIALDRTLVQSVTPFLEANDYIPDNLKSTLEGMLQSQDPKRMGFALRVLSDLDKINPRATDLGLSEENQKTVQSYSDLGLFIDNDEEVGQLIIARQKDAGAVGGDDRLGDEGKKYAQTWVVPYVQGLFAKSGVGTTGVSRGLTLSQSYYEGSVFGGDIPSLPDGNDLPAMEADALRIYIEAYKHAGGDKQLANKLFERGFKKVWGESKVGGIERIMRHPPEKWNPKGMETDWQTRQSDARVRPVIGDQPYILHSDDRTDVEIRQGKCPTWLCMIPISPDEKAADEEKKNNPDDGQIKIISRGGKAVQ